MGHGDGEAGELFFDFIEIALGHDAVEMDCNIRHQLFEPVGGSGERTGDAQDHASGQRHRRHGQRGGQRLAAEHGSDE